MTASSQRGFEFETHTYDFGTVKSWDNPPAVFRFENNSFDAQYILSPKVSRNVYVDYPRNKIESAEKSELRIYFYTSQTGNFQEEILIYTSGSHTPIKLTIKGNIKSLSDNALTQCPDFNQTNKPEPKENLVGIKFINKLTKEPVSLVLATLGRDKFYSQKNGELNIKLSPGVYGLYAQADGYHPFSEYIGIKSDIGTLVIELIPADQPISKDTLYVENPVINVDTLTDIKDDNPLFSYREYKANHIVMLLDVSGSMKQRGKIDSLKIAIHTLANQLRSVDRVTIITFSSFTQDILTNTPGDQKQRILPEIDKLQGKGTTDGVLGIEKAYAQAINYFIEGGNNQVIIATDGIFNSPNYSESQLLLMIRSFKNKGIKLSVIGFGKEKNAVGAMRKMSSEGGGNYISFSEGNQVRELLLQEIKQQSKRLNK
ncbi:MAG: VWA domain-containing protein [Candidatus Competibacteraceae bacterium]|nr:VWA domain-containing protein [Candidatus Competibacteraceae bacterium]